MSPFSLCTKRQNEQAEAGVPGDEPWVCGITQAAKGHIPLPAICASSPKLCLSLAMSCLIPQGRDRDRDTPCRALLPGPGALTAAQ